MSEMHRKLVHGFFCFIVRSAASVFDCRPLEAHRDIPAIVKTFPGRKLICKKTNTAADHFEKLPSNHMTALLDVERMRFASSVELKN